METVEQFFSAIMQSRDVAHIAHLQTTSYAQHVALDSYYKSIIEEVDSLIELHQGMFGIVKIVIPQSNFKEPVEYLESLAEYIERNKKELFPDSVCLNQIDAISHLIYTTLYKLKNLK